MKTNILRRATGLISVLVLLAALLTTSASAVPSGSIAFSVPFDFSVAGKTLPAGDYLVVRSTLNSNDILSVRRVDGHEGVYVLTSPVRAREIQNDSKLVFNRYENKYFLTEFWTSGEDSGRKVIKSEAEQSLAKAGTKAERVAIALAKK